MKLLRGSVVVLKPDAVLGLATGSTPVGTYKELIKDYEAGKLDFSAVKSVNLDEYKGLTGDHDQSYRYFMNTNLFNHVNIITAFYFSYHLNSSPFIKFTIKYTFKV